MLGKEALAIFELLFREKRDLTEDEISEKTGLAKNVTRKNLYHLQEYRLVSYKRIKNRETGWYYYYWRVNSEELPLVLLDMKREIVAKLKLKAEALSRGASGYVCPKCGRRYSFDEAFNREFTCEVCNVELVYTEEKLSLDKLWEIINRLEEEIRDEQRKIQGG